MVNLVYSVLCSLLLASPLPPLTPFSTVSLPVRFSEDGPF